MLRKNLIVIMMIMALFATAAWSAGMGTIDVQKVFFNYKEAKKMQDDFADKEKAYKDKLQKKQDELEKAQSDPNKYKQLKKKIEEDLDGDREKLVELNQKLSTDLKEKILQAVKKVAKSYALDSVVDKQVVLYGGIEITDWVVDELNKK